jgi:hypothetical protein
MDLHRRWDGDARIITRSAPVYTAKDRFIPFVVRLRPLLDDGLGQDPVARDRVEDNEDEHRKLAEHGAFRVAQEAQRDQVRQVDGDHVPGHDQRDLRVSDKPRLHETVPRLEPNGAEVVPPPP